MSSYRDLSNSTAVYQASLRDHQVAMNGVISVAEIPTIENNTDLYGDFDPTSIRKELIPVIPLFSQYYLVLSAAGEDMEDSLPLDVIIRTCDHIPRNTIFELESIDSNKEMTIRKWRVLSTEIKHIDYQYTKVAHCVPYRSISKDLS